ncbi:MAG: NAD(P)H-hydrate epimerase [Candidatus Hodarchaeales archaeon]|jgi:NAD(P)H-hydrate epimerase
MIPYITVDQMREVDRLMVNEYRIELIQMMENAGRNLAMLSRSRFLSSDPRESNILILAGTGGNGGGGLVCARHLHNWGANVNILLSKEPELYKGVSAHQLCILEKMGLLPTIFKKTMGANIDLIIDAIIGYSLSGNPRDKAAEMIAWTNEQKNIPVLSLDTPSGIDPDGVIHDPAIKATATMTLALPKKGFKSDEIRDFLGELYVADISVPPNLYSSPSINLEVGSIFSEEEIIRIY